MKVNKNYYNKNWKILRLKVPNDPIGIKEWLWMIWGFDIFFGRVPFLKVIVLCNILIWVFLFL